MKTRYIFLTILFIFHFKIISAQVLIARSTETNPAPDPSAILEIKDSKAGILFPQVPLSSNLDALTVNTPLNGLMVYNTTTSRYNFWQNSSWNKNFEIPDGTEIIKITKNYPGNSSNSTTLTNFPSSMPLFALNSTTTNWTSLNTSTTITVTKAVNTNYFIAEGMTQIDNTTTNQQYQYAIGIFVDGQLKIVRKYFADSKGYTCMWNKFSLSGVFDNLSVGSHLVSVYAYNLPRPSGASYTGITYGGNTSNCTNINDDMARIYINAQITQ